MTDFNYKKYSLENLENWLHDALSCGEASPHEIYSVIRKVVQDEYNYHKEQSQKCLGVLELLSGHRPVSSDDDCMPPWGHSDLEYMVHHSEDKVVKWQLPVEVDYTSGEYYVHFPDDLMEAANLEEKDKIEWIDNSDGTYTLKKINV